MKYIFTFFLPVSTHRTVSKTHFLIERNERGKKKRKRKKHNIAVDNKNCQKHPLKLIH